MILYTPLSEADVYPAEAETYNKYKTVNCSGTMVDVECLENGSYRVVRLQSTNPQDYLNEQLAPGQIITP